MQVERIAFSGSLRDSKKLRKNGLYLNETLQKDFEQKTARYKNYVLSAEKYDIKTGKTFFMLSKGQNKKTVQIPFKFIKIDESIDNALKIFSNLLMKLENKRAFLKY